MVATTKVLKGNNEERMIERLIKRASIIMGSLTVVVGSSLVVTYIVIYFVKPLVKPSSLMSLVCSSFNCNSLKGLWLICKRLGKPIYKCLFLN